MTLNCSTYLNYEFKKGELIKLIVLLKLVVKESENGQIFQWLKVNSKIILNKYFLEQPASCMASCMTFETLYVVVVQTIGLR